MSERVEIVKEEWENFADAVWEEIDESTPEPAPKIPPDAPFKNSANQPTYYDPELYPEDVPLQSTARCATSPGISTIRIKRQTIAEEDIGKYPKKSTGWKDKRNISGMIIGKEPYVKMVQKGDYGKYGEWEVDTGQYDRNPTTGRTMEDTTKALDALVGEKRSFGRGVQRRVGNKKIVLEHLDTRPIICDNEAQARREAERVGKELLFSKYE